jgi:hypothetical protein
MKKLMLLTAGAVGYVLGTKAGRERYEQIKAGAMKLKNNPTVQQKAHDAAQAAKEHAPIVKDKVADAAAQAKSAAQDKMGSNGSDTSPTTDTGMPTSTTATGYPQT